MRDKLGFLVLLEAKEGKGGELGDFLRAGRELAVAEEGTVTWYAIKVDESHFAIFDTFDTEQDRTAHVNGPIAKALTTITPELLASAPSIQPVDVIAVK
jgi:quinol monooxygenase YgiN